MYLVETDTNKYLLYGKKRNFMLATIEEFFRALVKAFILKLFKHIPNGNLSLTFYDKTFYFTVSYRY